MPSSVGVEYYTGSEWKSVSNLKYSNITNDLTLDFDSVSATKIRVVLTPTANKAVGITEIMVMGSDPSASAIPDGVVVEEKKFITQNDIVASVITLKNNSNQRVSFDIKATPSKGKTEEKFGYRYILFGGKTYNSVVLSPEESFEVKVVIAVSDNAGESATKISEFMADEYSVINHKAEFLNWFENNIPYFDCDNENLVEIYYFRWLTYRNNIRKITDKWNG